jgi:hypothetical protein
MMSRMIVEAVSNAVHRSRNGNRTGKAAIAPAASGQVNSQRTNVYCVKEGFIDLHGCSSITPRWAGEILTKWTSPPVHMSNCSGCRIMAEVDVFWRKASLALFGGRKTMKIQSETNRCDREFTW